MRCRLNGFVLRQHMMYVRKPFFRNRHRANRGGSCSSRPGRRPITGGRLETYKRHPSQIVSWDEECWHLSSFCGYQFSRRARRARSALSNSCAIESAQLFSPAVERPLKGRGETAEALYSGLFKRMQAERKWVGKTSHGLQDSICNRAAQSSHSVKPH